MLPVFLVADSPLQRGHDIGIVDLHLPVVALRRIIAVEVDMAERIAVVIELRHLAADFQVGCSARM